MRPPEKDAAYWLVAVTSPVAIVLAWDGLSRFGVIDPLLLPAPGAIATALKDVIVDGYAGVGVLTHVGVSLYRVAAAFLAAVVVGVVIGLLRGVSPKVDAAFLVPFEIVRPIPPLAFISLFILWFGIGEVSKILIIFYSSMLIIALNAQAGVAACPPDKVRAARSLGASPWRTFSQVILPAALPQTMVGLRVALATALSILVAAELLGGDRGLGFVISDASTFFKTNDVFVGIILIGAIGLLSDRALAWIGRRYVHWEGRS
ncbi:ABC transporter permease [Methylopila musalis]|uniref:ABC transporter permease n=1 Tax=Methylopila musalis TaxID=1134781 RepID=A0ABW3Z6B6_9HYPH